MGGRARWMIGAALVLLAAGFAALLLLPGAPGPGSPLESPRASSAAPAEASARASETPGNAALAIAMMEPGGGDRARRGGITVFGRAVLHEGAPTGLAIRVAIHSRGDASALVSYEGTLIDSQAAQAAGEFRFEHVPIRDLLVLGTAPGYASRHAVSLRESRAPIELLLELSPTATIAGRVVNTAREPVAGAEVFAGAFTMGGAWNFESREESLASRCATDERGGFEIELFRNYPNEEVRHLLAVRAEGYASYLSAALAEGTRDAELVLSEGSRVAGRLVDAQTGGALADKRIALESPVSVEQFAVVSDAGGNFFLGNVAPGVHVAMVVDEELVITPESARFQVSERETTEGLVLRATPGARIFGRVVESGSGAGVPGVSLSAWHEETQRSLAARSGGDGAYQFAGLRAGGYRVQVNKPAGYGSRGTGTDHPWTVTAGIGDEIGGIDFKLTRGVRVSGGVEDELGNPVAGASVSGYTQGYHGRVNDSASTGADGRFELAGFEAGSTIILRAEMDGFTLFGSEPKDQRVTLGEEDVAGVRLILGEESSISGVVVDSQGRGKPSIYLHAVNQNASSVGGGGGAQSAADGRFTIGGLHAGTYSFKFSLGNWEHLPTGTQIVSVGKGEKLSGVRIVYPEVAGLKISGRVIDRRGQPVRAKVMTETPRGNTQIQTDATGSYQFEGLAPGSYHIEALSRTMTTHSIEAEAGATNADIVLEDRASVEGRVIDAQTGRAVSVFHVWTSGTSLDVKDAEGRFQLTNVDAGAPAVEVSAEGYAKARVAIGPLAGGETRRGILVRVEPEIVLSGRVVDPSGAGIGAVSILLGDRSGEGRLGDSAEATTQADGRFRIPSLLPGPLTVTAVRDGFAAGMASVVLSRVGENYAEIVVNGGASVAGIVRVEGAPRAGQNVSILDGARTVETDARGYYRIDGIMPGAIEIHAKGGHRSKAVTARLVGDEVTTVNFDFSSGTAAIEGTLFGERGTPLINEGWVNALCQFSEGNREWIAAEVDGSGHYVIEGVPEGRITLSAGAGERPQRKVTLVAAEGQRIEQDFELFGGATLRVEVAGATMAGTTIARVALLHGAAAVPELSMPVMNALNEIRMDVVPIKQGIAKLEHLGAGIYTVVAWAYDYTRARPGADPFEGARWTTAVVSLEGDEPVTIRLDL